MSQDTEDRNQGRPTKGKQPSRPRKQHSGETLRSASLKADPLNTRKVSGSSSEHAQRPQRMPPGLFDSVENKPEHEGQPAEGSDSDEPCFICGNSMNDRYYSLAPCNNAFCHNCSLRLRALYKSTNCPFCKVSHLHLVNVTD
jgi:hypothetical protein